MALSQQKAEWLNHLVTVNDTVLENPTAYEEILAKMNEVSRHSSEDEQKAKAEAKRLRKQEKWRNRT
jgi:hypothetical protein